MLRTAVIGSALVIATLGAGNAPKRPVPAVVADAPADEYFGPFKYSAISTRSRITALGRSYRERWQDDAAIVHDAGMVESSLRAWAAKYPKDRWLAPTAFHLAQLYFEVQSPDARTHARGMFAYVASTFPATKEGHLARLRMHQGFPALHAERPVSPTPSPYGPAAAPAASPIVSPAPPASSAPAPSTAPGASPAPR